MDVGQVILGRPWLFDKTVTIYSRSNMCQFEHEGKRIKLLFLRPKTGQLKQTSTLVNSTLSTSHCYCSLLFPISHAYSVRKLLLLYWRYHPIIEHSSLHLHLHHTNTSTNYTKRSVMKPTLRTSSRKYLPLMHVII